MSRFLADKYQSLVAYTPGEQPTDMNYIKLNTNESPYPPSFGVIKALNREEAEKLRREAEEEARYVSELASKLYYIPMYKGEYELNNDIEVIYDKPIEITGELKVNKLKLENTELETDAVFVLKDTISPGQLVPGLEIEDGHIKVDREMKTNIDGCFAAGDCVGKPYQYIKSAGEGNIASLSAVKYLDNLKIK